jgi:hypothetical protein
MSKGTDWMIAEAARQRDAERRRVKAHCRTCGAPLTLDRYDCGGACATTSTTTEAWGVWRSWADREDGHEPIAVCTSEDAAKAVQRLLPGSYRGAHWTYSHRPQVAGDIRPPMTDAEEAEFWNAPLRGLDHAAIAAGVKASEDARHDREWIRREMAR